MKILIETIPHEKQRYTTVGDWLYEKDGTLHILVSKLSNPRLEQLIAVHELIEVLCCEHNGVSQDQVDKFDFEYQGEGEPGDDPNAPYKHEHCLATAVERMLAAEFGVDWKTYEDELEALPEIERK